MNSRQRRRGLATVTAIALLGLVAVAMLAVSAAVVGDARRTRYEAADAQVRQLLLAAAADAAERAAAWPADVADDSWQLALPATLAQSGGASVKLSLAHAGETLEVRVDAHYLTHRGGQTLRFRRSAERWELIDAAPDTATVEHRPQ
jgi:hypothetical protein